MPSATPKRLLLATGSDPAVGISADDWNELASIPGTIPKPPKRVRPKKEPKPRKPFKQKNAKRAKATRAKNFGPQSAACWDLPCYPCGREGASVPHHDPSQKNGGTDKNTMPMCCATRMYGVPGCHQKVHSEGRETFWNRIGSTPEKAIADTRLQAGITIYD